MLTEIAQMRGLLDEMGRLGGGGEHAGVEAPKKPGVAKKFIDGVSYVKNYYTFMTAGYVADRLKEVLDVCGTRLDLSAGDLAVRLVRSGKINCT